MYPVPVFIMGHPIWVYLSTNRTHTTHFNWEISLLWGHFYVITIKPAGLNLLPALSYLKIIGVFLNFGGGVPIEHVVRQLVTSLRTHILVSVAEMVCLISSRLSSVSWLFWISDRFCSSRSAKMSSSCWGSVKNSSGSWQTKTREIKGIV